MTDVGVLAKAPGELKDAHDDRLATVAPVVLDIDRYVEEFGRSIVPAYRQGIADRELAADAGLARSLIPPGTSAVRDFSRLAPRIPELVAERCVGCMACVSACPDSAILGVVTPASELPARIDAASEGDAARRAALEARFTDTQKYGELPARRGLDRGAFGLFVDPAHCKGCGECVDVCAALGHDALFMTDKLDEEPASGTSTIERFAADMAFYRSLPPTPSDYRNDKALADLMLGEHAIGYVGGAGSCAGCGEASAIRMLVAATRQVHGPESMGIVASTGCNTVFGSTYPFNPYLVPWTNSLFENGPTVALGIRARWDAAGHPERRLWVLGGDGAMYDIGFQALSRMVASGADLQVLVLDTQVYSNTGGQASTATFGGQVTKLSAYGKAVHGKPERRKELGRILMAHGDVYVAQTTPAHLNHFYRSIIEANEYPGPAVVIS
ncbi:MAG TPA: thiamine pyrophosphate-dependent enzyme, partial [Candidatus Limnocylindrales bacterium]